MGLREAIYARLQTENVCGGRIHFIKRPDNAIFPCVSYQLTSEIEDKLLDPAEQGLVDSAVESTFALDVWDRSDTGVVASALSTKTALDDYFGTISGVDIERIMLENEQDSYEDGAEIFRVLQFYRVMYLR